MNRCAVSMVAIATAVIGHCRDAHAEDQMFKMPEYAIDFHYLRVRACADPMAFSDGIARLDAASSGLDETGTEISPNLAADIHDALQTVRAYYPDACSAAEKMADCAIGTLMTAEQACDCAAGYVGDTRYGIGVTELQLSLTYKLAEQACPIAIEAAYPMDKARLLAQLGRGLLQDPTVPAERGDAALSKAVEQGYRRAEIDHARALLAPGADPRVPAESIRQHLTAARNAGALEAEFLEFQLVRREMRAAAWIYDPMDTDGE